MPPVVLERPKMSRAVWEALKTHIMKERHRKKQELEADAEVERQRKERERQLKQDSMTLSETREQIASLDSKLQSLKDEKHQLFMQLKKVLHEDDTRRRQLLSKESEMLAMHNYIPQPGLQLGTPPQMLFQPVLTRPAMYTMPRVSHGPSHGHQTLMAPRFDGPMKRSRSPSPPPQQYKFGPFKPPPQAIHPYPHKLPFADNPVQLQYYHAPPSQSPQQPNQPQQHHVSVSYPTAPHPPQHTPTIYAYAGAPPSRSPQNTREEQKHVPTGLYLHHGQPLPRAYVVHQQLDHPSQAQKFEDNQKYYPPPSHSLPIRGPAHMSLHPGLTIQPPQGGTGGITSGYPIRSTPSVSSYQGRPPSPHVVYASQGGPTRLTYGHGPPQHGPPTVSPHGQHSHQQQVTISRYSLPPGLQRD